VNAAYNIQKTFPDVLAEEVEDATRIDMHTAWHCVRKHMKRYDVMCKAWVITWPYIRVVRTATIKKGLSYLLIMLIKATHDDFRVVESPKITHERDDCLVFSVTKSGWDTTLLVKELAKRLMVSQKRIGYAGLKDTAARTTQWMSVKGVDPEQLENVRLPRVEITSIMQGDCISIGDLKGNRFEVVVRDIQWDASQIKHTLDASLERFSSYNGFINYFGHQRFGIQRPITADVGRHLVKKEYEQAALTFLAKQYPDDPHADIRRELWDSKDFKRAYEEFPHSLKYERAMLFQLGHKGSTYLESFKALPERLQTLFIHAYQAELFNEIVRRRVQEIPPNEVEIGDMIMIDKFERKATTFVNSSNMAKVRGLLRQTVSLAAPLIGSKTIFPRSRMGEIAREVLTEEGLSCPDFENHDHRPFSSTGSTREVVGRFSDLEYTIDEDEMFDAKKCIVTFFLPRGEYATELLRQLFGQDVLPFGVETQ